MADENNLGVALKKELKYCVQKLHSLIKGKADEKHTHSMDDISETTTKKILTTEERNTIKSLSDTIETSGDGTKILYDDGTYKEPGSPDLIDDSTSLEDKTYSSKKIDEELNAKSKTFANESILESIKQTDLDMLHAHSNKTALDGISEQNISNWNSSAHTHSNKTVLDGITSEKISEWDGKISHTHSNKDVLDKITSNDVNNIHTHSNKTVLDGITSEKISEWDGKISHTHSNKDVLDKIISDGTGSKILNDKGEYVDDIRKWDDLSNKPFSTIESELFTVVNEKLGLKYPVKEMTLADYTLIKNNIVPNMIYIVKDTEKGKNAIYLNGTKYAEVNDTSLLAENGDGTKFLNDKREYTVPDYSAVIKDTSAGAKTTYSSEKIESRLDEVQYDISHGVEGNLTLYQRTMLNVTNGDVKYFETSNTSSIYKAVIQPFKFVEGEQNIEEIIKTYDNTDADNFNYNSNTVEFGDNGMKIKDCYTLTYSAYGEYFISEPFNKNDFIELNTIAI